jgi:hypothetical protein
MLVIVVTVVVTVVVAVVVTVARVLLSIWSAQVLQYCSTCTLLSYEDNTVLGVLNTQYVLTSGLDST